MRTIKIITFAALFVTAMPLTAQDTTKPFSFPHKTGDMWEYLYFEFGTPYTDTVQNFTISDSTDSQGIIHITQYARRINPIGGPYFFTDTTKYRIDTVNNYVFGNAVELFDVLVYKLNAKQGEQWVIGTHIGGGYEIARVVNKREGVILGKETTIMQIEYYGAADSSDTTGLDRYYDEIADGFGLVFRVAAEYSGEIHLIGAVINDTLYGDTTVVSVKERDNFLPLSIKLNQNYPNPFNPSTTISFEIYEQSNISLIVYDVLGKEIFRLIDKKDLNAGEHKVTWNGLKENGTKAASGIYFYRLITDNQSLSRSMILLK
jgi:hypothetical protein